MDRIYEAYAGDMGEALMKGTRDRLDWICSSITGGTVLDVGCSQGIGSILIAETGRSVTGIDANQEAIDFANRLLEEDYAEQKDKVNFITADFCSFFDKPRYDCVVLGEVLEYSFHPEVLVERAYRLLKPEGELVVTVPFGINDAPGHGKTFYYWSLRRILEEYFYVSETVFGEKWLGVISRRRDEACGADCSISLIEGLRIEQAFYSVELEYISRLSAQNNEILRIRALDEDNQETIRKLNLSIKVYRKEVHELSTRERIYKEKYDILAKSKPGRFALWCWRTRDAVLRQFMKGDPDAKTIRNFAKKIPGLRPTVIFLRKLFNTESKQEKPALNDYGPILLTEGDEGFFGRVKDKADQIPVSNGCRYYEKLPYRIGIVCDRFFYDSVYSAADFVYVSPDNWEKAIDGIDFLLVVSTWRGVYDGEWISLGKEGSQRQQLLRHIIHVCREVGIPTVFYSKEDPVNYKVFISTANQCDYAFTTDSDMLPNYIADCGHDRVGEMGFGINPAFHNPVGMHKFDGEKAVLFSGSWMLRHEERCVDMCMVFDGALDSGRGLQIIDRNYQRHGDVRYSFPDKYFCYAAPTIEHDDLQRVHKLYDWALNINTVKHSPTMFANRVIELQASGNLLISNMSIGVYNRMPTVFLAHDKGEVSSILSAFSPEEVYERKVSGIRKVMTDETCYDRMAWLCRSIGLEAEKQIRTVAVVADELTDNIKAMFEDQTCPNRQLIRKAELTEELLDGFDAVAFWDDDAYYGVFYLEDMMNAFKYTDCDYITKNAYYCEGTLVPGAEHDFTETVGSVSRSVFWVKSFDYERLMNMEDGDIVPKGYSIDHFNYELRPLPAAQNSTTYKISVIVPVYNNGWFLYGKALASLRRSSMFEDMEIILVDDGSTDGFTPQMLKHLERFYPNVRTYFFNDGGSGSASRPRNKGLELASAEYIAYLDPDDEAINDGIAKLYNLILKSDAELAVGNMMRIDDEQMVFEYSDFIEKALRKRSRKRMSVETGFQPVSNQSMVVKKSVLVDNGITQVVGGIGEDTLFSYQVLDNSKKTVTLDLPIFIYYACRQSSVVNNLSSNFFRKYKPVAEEYIRWMSESNILNDYMSMHFVHYVNSWLFKKLSNAAYEQSAECAKELYEVLKIYEPYYKRNDKTINRFLCLCSEERFKDAYEYICQQNKK